MTHDDVAIRVLGLSKQYRLGSRMQRADTLVGSITGMIKSPWTNFRRLRRLTRIHENESQAADILWALKDVYFDVKPGEVVGIIGRNGAGKSTLLKILSQITEPTFGRIELTGRVASLLEVGTGFHSELSGRENVYLNGTILGMTRREIDRKFDAIVDFSGIERFIDTPVKHYSSGMQVRLAFAVAAHLEPEILIIDEVLAVGDAGFQEKCLGKMQDVATQGRTVLFVSHDLSAVEKLCTRAILIDGGKMQVDGPTAGTLAQYQKLVVRRSSAELSTRTDRKGAGEIKFTQIQLLDGSGHEPGVFLSGDFLRIRLHYRSPRTADLVNCRVSVSFYSCGKVYFIVSTELFNSTPLSLPANGFVDCVIEELPLSLGTYYLNPFLEVNGIIQDTMDAGATLRVEDGNFYGTGKDYPIGWDGKTVLVRHRWMDARSDNSQ